MDPKKKEHFQQDPFTPPKGYFDSLEKQMMQRVADEQKVKKMTPKFHHPVWYGTAAVIIFLIGFYVFLPQPEQEVTTSSGAFVSWIEENPEVWEDFSEYELARYLDEPTSQASSDTISFLLAEDVEVELIYDEL